MKPASRPQSTVSRVSLALLIILCVAIQRAPAWCAPQRAATTTVADTTWPRASLQSDTDAFGSAVALSGDTIVIGAPEGDVAYVFVRPAGGWHTMTPTAVLAAPDTMSGARFGASVAISGNTVVVGAPLAWTAGDAVGAAYVFERPTSGWGTAQAAVAKLAASGDGDAFELGSAVAISGNTIVAGARFATVGDEEVPQGAAYVYIKPAAGWSTGTGQTARLTASDGELGNAFGSAVAISGDTIVVGDPWADHPSNPCPDMGAAYIYVKPPTGWADMTQTARLRAPNASSDEFSAEFGGSVAISGSTIAIGARFADVGTLIDQGAAFVYEQPVGGWVDSSQAARLTAAGEESTEFGVSVATNGEAVVVGDTAANDGSGGASVFIKPTGGWGNRTADAMLRAVSGYEGDCLGASAAMEGDTLVLGAPSATPSRADGYLYIKPGAGWRDATQTAILTPWHRLNLPMVRRP